ncbi:DUF3040 domain-containing protein [Galbitalea soli]|uniref:DUF3040 domain-containing protein n=1 Tax=Galbitalea soli TaxID=1268042 RepID=A0A7C9TPG3_9MICO|nr:DUF3040 domain-containing protein [Galbitalea soli]NEM90002.1 DUF3040 domain-containing protein [Galbitalea soli]NYJ30709.1 hypothetical protein [Galbitalea soli]
MPLSEQEQRLLEEMERSLYHNDADFVASVSARRGKPSYSAVVLGILLAVAGVAVLITGVAVRLPIVGVLGFVMMFAGVFIAVTPPRRGGRVSSAPSSTARPSFMQTLGQRWEKRQHDHEE